MKMGLLFVLIVLMVFIFFGRDATKIALEGNLLKIYSKKCSIKIDVAIEEKSSDLVDEVQIDRLFLRLPNKQSIVLERINLDPKHDFGMPYNELLTSLFQKKAKEIFAKNGMRVFWLDSFYVALFDKTKDDLVLLYPLDKEIVQALQGCRSIDWSRVHIPPLLLSKWDIKLIILDGLIEKDI